MKTLFGPRKNKCLPFLDIIMLKKNPFYLQNLILPRKRQIKKNSRDKKPFITKTLPYIYCSKNRHCLSKISVENYKSYCNNYSELHEMKRNALQQKEKSNGKIYFDFLTRRQSNKKRFSLWQKLSAHT